MKLINTSRAVIENGNLPLSTTDHWLISIYSSNHYPAKVEVPFARTLVVNFDDVNKVCDYAKAITLEQAEAIATFIKEAVAANVEYLWVHCDAGICRSGAIVAAASLLENCFIDDTISNGRVPNQRVFTAVRHCLGIKYSFED